MDRASSLIYPGSRTLAGWWRLLAPMQPQAWWIGYAFVHRIEASVCVQRSEPVDSLTHHILAAIELEQRLGPNHVPGISLARLEDRLRLPAVMLRRLLVDIVRTDLIASATPESWHVSARGTQALQSRQVANLCNERRIFPFVELLDPAGQRTGAPLFLPLAECTGVPWEVDSAHRMDLSALPACLAQTTDWKQTFAFPGDVESIQAGSSTDAWKHVIVDRPQRVLLSVMIAGQQLVAFAVKVNGWGLDEKAPVLKLPISARAAWPGPAADVPHAAWQESWQAWCRERQLPAGEVNACQIAHRPPRLEIQAPPRLLQRLQASKSDLFKGEAWLLVGDGYVRTAAQLAVRPLS
jgi:hypothetical protein